VILAIIAAVAVATWLGSWVWGVIAGVIAYFLHSWAKPTARCLWCHGEPRSFSRSGGSWGIKGPCRVFCGGTGARRRAGAVLLNSMGVRTNST
jgi:hypothetical protein